MNFKRIFFYYWKVAKEYKIAIFSILFLASGRVLFSMISAGYIYKNIIDTLNNTTLSINTRYDIVIWFLVAMGTSFFISLSMSRWNDYVYYRLLTKSIQNIYDNTFAKLITHSYNFFNDNFAGSLVTKVKRFTQSYETTIEILFKNFWELILSVIFSVTALYFQSPILALYLLVWCVLYSILMIPFIKGKLKIDVKWAQSDSRVTGALSDAISNIFNIKIFSAFKKEKGTFQNVVQDYVYKFSESNRYYVIRASIQAFLMVLFHIFILYTMINLWNKGVITVGVFVMTYIFILGVFDRIWDLSNGLIRLMKAMTDAKEMVDILDKVPDISDPQNPEKLRITDGEIKFEDVSFEYVDDTEVFNDFNLHIQKGQKVGLVGHSGSGKSTITKMLLRFVDLKKGTISIDGQDITSITQDDLRSKISYVPQDTILFHRSIMENIAYSKADATEEEVIEAAKKAHAHEFIIGFKDGYSTLVGERGVKLSGGERQRIAIARAMLKDAPILVLDEATSSLDSVSESYIQQAFDELMKDKTTIVIAHRLSTIQKMDRILVLEKGQIIEDGTHADLLAKGGVYSSLWEHQTGGFL